MKHAYLIMIHNTLDTFQYLCTMLDDRNHDLYVHVDKKVPRVAYERLKNRIILHHAQIHWMRKVKVNWGGFSMVKCEICLMSDAVKTHHDYYHLVSGADLPLKSNSDIDAFFTAHVGMDFIDSGKKFDIERMSLFHFFQEFSLFRNHKVKIPGLSLSIQRLLKINRLKNTDLLPDYGAQWFSLREETIFFILDKWEKYKKSFRFTHCCDEMFIQTIIKTEHFPIKTMMDHNGYTRCMRHIDWDRGNPYVWTDADYEELKKTDDLFARKFDYKKGFDIINKLYNELKEV